jgi:hypothetical protein
MQTQVGSSLGVEMASAREDESFHSVTLSVSGRVYTASIWRGSATEWRLLSVRLGSDTQMNVQVPPFQSCRSALEEAEKIAIKAIAQERERHSAAM